LYENRNSLKKRPWEYSVKKQEIAKKTSTFNKPRSGMDYSSETRKMRRNFSSNRFKNVIEHDRCKTER
jgi:hypothetical protein